MPSLPDSVMSLLLSAVTFLSGLTICPPHSRLLHLGLDSFDVVRIANEVGRELEAQFGSCDGHVTGLEEVLLEREIVDVVKYIVDELTSGGRGSIAPSNAIEGSHHVTGEGVVIGEDTPPNLRRARSASLDSGVSAARERWGLEGSHESHVTDIGDQVVSPASKRVRMDSGRSCEGHLTSAGGQMSVVESWRRGQYFRNGK